VLRRRKEPILADTAVFGLTGAHPHTEVVDLDSLKIPTHTLITTVEAFRG